MQFNPLGMQRSVQQCMQFKLGASFAVIAVIAVIAAALWQLVSNLAAWLLQTKEALRSFARNSHVPDSTCTRISTERSNGCRTEAQVADGQVNQLSHRIVTNHQQQCALRGRCLASVDIRPT